MMDYIFKAIEQLRKDYNESLDRIADKTEIITTLNKKLSKKDEKIKELKEIILRMENENNIE